MILTAISEFVKECSDWKENLHSYRDELHSMQHDLQKAINYPLSKEEQTELEHFQNQLYIQLINVHDLKRAVKLHNRQLDSDNSISGSHYADNFPAYHENLNDSFQSLSNTLDELRGEVYSFIQLIQ